MTCKDSRLDRVEPTSAALVPGIRPDTGMLRSPTLLAAAILPIVLLVSLNPPCTAVTLVSRSAGLELPVKEEGRTELEIGDLNGDGDLDVVSVGDHGNPRLNSDEHGIMVWLGNGAGAWAVQQTGEFGYGGCAIGDLDLDGLVDLAWGVHHNYDTGMGSRLISAARGNGSGAGWSDWGAGLGANGETWGMFATALADFDGDGFLDILSESFGGSNGLRLYRNHGDGTWTPAWAFTGGTVQYTVESCDVNADGYADIVCTRSGTNAFLGDGTFGFTAATAGLPAGTIRCVDAADMDADGRDDMVFALGSSGLRCCRYAPGPGAWEDASSGLPASGTYTMCQFGDLDGDTDLDIVAYAAPTGCVYLGDGTGHWVADATWTMPSPGDASALRVDGDVDHDGREDILVQATQSGFPFYRNQLRVYSPYSPPAALAARVVSPRGGELLRIGSTREIRWLSAVPEGQGPATVDLWLSLAGADGPWTLLASGRPDNGRCQWRVGGAGPSTTCRIRIKVTTSQGSVTVTSPRDFDILQPEGSPVSEGALPLTGNSRLTPNPSRDVTALLIGSNHGRGSQVDLVSPAGRVLRRWREASSDRIRLELLDEEGRNLPRGVYFVRIIPDRGRVEVLRLVHR